MLITWMGALALGTGFAITLANVVKSLRGGTPAGPDPWEAGTLEWATSSPPPAHNFDAVPAVNSRMPLWYALGEAGESGVAPTQQEDRRVAIGTSTLDGEPEQRLLLAGPAIEPLILALGAAVAFYGALISLWSVPIGALIVLAAVVLWNWPGRSRKKEQPE